MGGLSDTVKQTVITATPTATIYIAGNYEQAMGALRAHCSEVGDCWAVEPVDFIYTGGLESGVRLTRIDYPRFPMSPDELQDHAEYIARRLLFALHQRSCTVVGPLRSTYMSRESER